MLLRWRVESRPSRPVLLRQEVKLSCTATDKETTPKSTETRLELLKTLARSLGVQIGHHHGKWECQA